MFRSSNPILSSNSFQQSQTAGKELSINGVVNKCYVLFGAMLLAAMFTWNLVASGQMAQANSLMMIGGIGGFALYFVMLFKPDTARIIAPTYAVGQGLMLGGLSAIFEQMYPGLVIQAVGLTFGVFFTMLGVYQSKIIEVNDRFRMIMVTSMGGIFLIYIIGWIMSLFGASPGIFGSGPLGIGFSLFVVGIASFSLLLNFEQIDQIKRYGATKTMEWFAAFGLLVSLVWLYIELLKLLVKLRSQDD